MKNKQHPQREYAFLPTLWSAAKTIDRPIALRMAAAVTLGTVNNLAMTGSLAFIGVSLIAAGSGFNPFGTSQVVDVVGTALALVGLEFTVANSLAVAGSLYAFSISLGWLDVLIGRSYSRLELRMRTDMGKRILGADWLLLQRRNTGDISTLWDSTQKLVSFYQSIGFFTSVAVELAIYIVGSFLLSWEITVLLIGIQLVSLLISRSFLVRLKRFHQKILETSRKKGASDIQILHNVKIVKSNAVVDRVIHLNYLLGLQLLKLNIRISYLNVAKNQIQGVLGFALLAGGVMLSFFILRIQPDLILLYVVLVQRLTRQLREFENSIAGFVEFVPSLGFVFDELGEIRRTQEVTGMRDPGLMRKGLVLKQVDFAYPLERQEGDDSLHTALCGVDISISAGSTVAIIGPSGAGKTTVLDIVIGLLRPQHGEVLLDGVSLSEYSTKKWRQNIAYVTQEALLFSGTIADNLRFYNPAATDKQLLEACEVVTMREHVEALPDRLETEVGERGGRLSGGQRQRLVLARALLKRASLLILDEATNQVDIESETQIHEMLASRSYSPTVLIVSHRNTTIMGSDIVYFVRDGRVVEHGSPQQLIEKQGEFYAYWKKSTAAPQSK